MSDLREKCVNAVDKYLSFGENRPLTKILAEEMGIKDVKSLASLGVSREAWLDVFDVERALHLEGSRKIVAFALLNNIAGVEGCVPESFLESLDIVLKYVEKICAIMSLRTMRGVHEGILAEIGMTDADLKQHLQWVMDTRLERLYGFKRG